MRCVGLLPLGLRILGRRSAMAPSVERPAMRVRAYKLNSVIEFAQPNPIAIGCSISPQRDRALVGGNQRWEDSFWANLKHWVSTRSRIVSQPARDRSEELWAAPQVTPLKAAGDLPAPCAFTPAPVPARPSKAHRQPVERISAAAEELSLLTESQRNCVELLSARAELFFHPPEEARHGIPIQTNSLIVGPAGSGKTTVARFVADSLGADFMHLSHGSWIVEGSHDSNSTIQIILWRAAHSQRLVVFFDELDKLTLSAAALSDWEVSLRNDLWLLFDRALSWGTWATRSGFVSHLPVEFQTAEMLEYMFKSRVFLLAAGTWQNLYRPAPVVGFVTSRGEGHLNGHQLNRNGGLPEEMLRRFNRELVHLEYPEITELEGILERDGLLQLAKEQGVVVDPAELRGQMDLVGMTALTSLKTSLLLHRMQKSPSPTRR